MPDLAYRQGLVFNKIVILEPIVITKEGREQLKQYCNELIIYDTTPCDENEYLERIGNAECILVSHSAKITRNIITKSSHLKYIGMGCSLYDERYSNVDLQACRDSNVVVLPLKDYGDEGTIEYIVAELLNLLHGLKGNTRKEKACELNSLKVGIIGLGTIGRMTARTLQHFGAEIFYYSRTRKPEFENEYIYHSLHELLQKVDVIIICVNRDSLVMDKQSFEEL